MDIMGCYFKANLLSRKRLHLLRKKIIERSKVRYATPPLWLERKLFNNWRFYDLYISLNCKQWYLFIYYRKKSHSKTYNFYSIVNIVDVRHFGWNSNTYIKSKLPFFGVCDLTKYIIIIIWLIFIHTKISTPLFWIFGYVAKICKSCSQITFANASDLYQYCL